MSRNKLSKCCGAKIEGTCFNPNHPVGISCSMRDDCFVCSKCGELAEEKEFKGL